MKGHLTANRLREVLRYDPESGAFTWLEPGPKRVVGAAAGYVTKGLHPYVQLGIDGNSYHGHRLAWLYMTGSWPTCEVDHKDRNKANNRWSNLRAATHKQNCENVAVRRHSGTGIKGVHFDEVRNEWQAYIGHNRKKIHLGRFSSAEAAAAARQAAEQIHFTHAHDTLSVS